METLAATSCSINAVSNASVDVVNTALPITQAAIYPEQLRSQYLTISVEPGATRSATAVLERTHTRSEPLHLINH